MRTGRRGAISIRSILMSSTAIGLIAASGIPAQPVYNLKLDGNHTYFADGYLAHNR
jgi:hypothetical protein